MELLIHLMEEAAPDFGLAWASDQLQDGHSPLPIPDFLLRLYPGNGLPPLPRLPTVEQPEKKRNKITLRRPLGIAEQVEKKKKRPLLQE